MGIAQKVKFDEWCPSCGGGVNVPPGLNPVTGFCYPCSPSVVGYQIPCETCGKDFIPFQNSRRVCSSCRRREWLYKNGDSIERVMVHYNIPAIEAIMKVADDNRPRCAMCGDKIKQGTKGRTKFCNKKDECRRAQIRYRNYKKRNGLSDDDALEKAVHGKPNTKTS